MMVAAIVVFATLGCALTLIAMPTPRDPAEVLRGRLTQEVAPKVTPSRWRYRSAIRIANPIASWRRSRRSIEFRHQFPDALLLLCGALRAGLAVRPALESVTTDIDGPVGEEWRQALLESQVGLTLDAALTRVAERTQSAEAGWLVELIAINREVGGDLGTVLTTLAHTLRERERQRRRIRALTAEARLSAIILCLLPPAFACYLTMVRRDYVGVLFTSPAGLAMTATAMGLLVVGILWMRMLVSAQAQP